MTVTMASPTPQKKTQPHYEEFKDILDKNKASMLPEHRPYDCPIDLQLVKDPLWDQFII